MVRFDASGDLASGLRSVVSVGRGAWRAVDWTKHLDRITVDGTVVNLVDIGRGAPLVLLHGLGGSWQNYLENILYFARTRRVLVPDLPGFGSTPHPGESVSISWYAELVSGLARTLGLDRIDVVGNSMGGAIAVESARLNPDLVRRLVLISPAGGGKGKMPPWAIRMGARAIRSSERLTVPVRRHIATRPALKRRAFRGVVRDPDRLASDLAFELLYGGARKGAFIEAVDSTLSFDARPRLPEVTQPTLVLWGRHDGIVSPENAEVFAKLLPNARILIQDDTAHLTMMEEPERVNPLISEAVGG